MKYILLAFFTFASITLYSQNATIIIKAQKQTVTASLSDDNIRKALSLNSTKKPLKTDKLIAYNNNSKELKEWKRSFMIFDETDAEVLTLKNSDNELLHQLPLKEVFDKLEKSKTYTLYTIALPKDPAKAAVVRVRRILMCTIRVK